MKTTIIKHQQGSQAWHEHRRTHRNASDAAAMLGFQAYKTRDQLIKEIATGLTEEVDAYTQKLFDKGHEFEAMARPWAEEIVDGDLYPVVLAGEIDGLKLSASLDGATMLGDVNWEHKSLNAYLAASLDIGEIPMQYHPQMEQGMMLSGAEKCLFMASSGDKSEMRWAWYEPNYNLRNEIIAGWRQLEKDVSDYVPTESAPAPVGHSPETLPALRIEVTGMVTASNLAEFKSHALAVFGGINRELVTDQDFASAESTVKWCSDVEQRLAAAKQHALSQTASIDALFRTIDDISAEARAVRLELDKLVKARKESIRIDIVQDAAKDLWNHCQGLKDRIGRNLMPAQNADFAGAIKSKRTLDNMRNAVNTELANAKIKANAVADQITVNLRMIDAQNEYAFLFFDVAQLVLKDSDYVAMVIKNRITGHQAAEVDRIAAETARIAEQERIKAEAEAQKRANAEIAQARADAQAKADKEIAIAWEKSLQEGREAAEAKQAIELAAETPLVLETVTVRLVEKSFDFATERDNDSTMKLGQICSRLGFTVTADFLSGLGFEPCATDKNAKLYKERTFPLICRELVRHIQSISQEIEA